MSGARSRGSATALIFSKHCTSCSSLVISSSSRSHSRSAWCSPASLLLLNNRSLSPTACKRLVSSSCGRTPSRRAVAATHFSLIFCKQLSAQEMTSGDALPCHCWCTRRRSASSAASIASNVAIRGSAHFGTATALGAAGGQLNPRMSFFRTPVFALLALGSLPKSGVAWRSNSRDEDTAAIMLDGCCARWRSTRGSALGFATSSVADSFAQLAEGAV
mmetsp:Transcript_19259/g.46370  ORF Transcript_19259/g.46370 Transcript_19259/m.46370 type:complete len:218 (+) Transcript_19259:467-1120(+)